MILKLLWGYIFSYWTREGANNNSVRSMRYILYMILFHARDFMTIFESYNLHFNPVSYSCNFGCCFFVQNLMIFSWGFVSACKFECVFDWTWKCNCVKLCGNPTGVCEHAGVGVSLGVCGCEYEYVLSKFCY